MGTMVGFTYLTGERSRVSGCVPEREDEEAILKKGGKEREGANLRGGIDDTGKREARLHD